MADSEWLFDYVLQILESDYFDAVIMDFVDENCLVFDNDEENKFIYTDLHNQFKEILEDLMTKSLQDLDVSNEVFYEAIEKGRNARDINRTVYEKLLAMEDFEHFKKIMVKRNIELQLEELVEYRAMQGVDSDEAGNNDGHLPDPYELEQRILCDLNKLTGPVTDEEMAAIVSASLLEMELIHKQEELERLELEQALALSLLVEEERLEMVREEAKQDACNEMDDKSFYRDDFKESAVTGSKEETSPSPLVVRTRTPPTAEAISSAKVSSKEEASNTYSAPVSAMANLTVSEPKLAAPRSLKALNPIRSKGVGSSITALPPINSGGMDGGNGSWVLDSQVDALEERKKRAEDAFRKNQDRMAEQRRADEEAKKRLLYAVSENSSGGPSPATAVEDERARNMRELRERMIAKKKAERDAKVKQEEEMKIKKKNDEKTTSPAMPKDASTERFIEAQRKAGQGDADNARREEEEAERKRAQVRRAMALHMKRELIESEEQKFREEDISQFSDLDRKLRKLENLYENNSQRSALMEEQIRAQEKHLAKSKKTAANLRNF